MSRGKERERERNGISLSCWWWSLTLILKINSFTKRVMKRSIVFADDWNHFRRKRGEEMNMRGKCEKYASESPIIDVGSFLVYSGATKI